MYIQMYVVLNKEKSGEGSKRLKLGGGQANNRSGD
jgi:hypothetical protein